MRDAWTRFRGLAWWKQALAWVGATVGAIFLAATIAVIIDPPEDEPAVEEAVEEAPPAPEPEEEPAPEPRALSPAQTLERIWADPDDACGTYGLSSPRDERRYFAGVYEVMAEDLPDHVEPASEGRTFRYMQNHCAAQLESLTAAETANRIYDDASEWCAAYQLAGGDNDGELRRIFRQSYRIAARELFEDGYEPAPANAVFDELRGRC